MGRQRFVTSFAESLQVIASVKEASPIIYVLLLAKKAYTLSEVGLSRRTVDRAPRKWRKTISRCKMSRLAFLRASKPFGHIFLIALVLFLRLLCEIRLAVGTILQNI